MKKSIETRRSAKRKFDMVDADVRVDANANADADVQDMVDIGEPTEVAIVSPTSINCSTPDVSRVAALPASLPSSPHTAVAAAPSDMDIVACANVAANDDPVAAPPSTPINASHSNGASSNASGNALNNSRALVASLESIYEALTNLALESTERQSKDLHESIQINSRGKQDVTQNGRAPVPLYLSKTDLNELLVEDENIEHGERDERREQETAKMVALMGFQQQINSDLARRNAFSKGSGFDKKKDAKDLAKMIIKFHG